MAGRICLGLIAQASLETFSFVRLLAISLPTARIYLPHTGPHTRRPGTFFKSWRWPASSILLARGEEKK